MVDALDALLRTQQEKLKQQRESTFWGRNKKLLVSIGIILSALWIFSISYVNYWLLRVHEASSSMK